MEEFRTLLDNDDEAVAPAPVAPPPMPTLPERIPAGALRCYRCKALKRCSVTWCGRDICEPCVDFHLLACRICRRRANL